jgi:hypothetical protein
MLQGLIGAVSVMPVAWTLSIELLFYASVRDGPERSHRLNSAGTPVGVVGAVRRPVRGGADDRAGPPRDVAPSCSTQPGWARPSTCVTARGARCGERCSRRACSSSYRAYLSVDGGEWQPFTYSSSFMAGLLLFGTFYWTRHLSLPRTLVWLGGISYALYLSHPTVSSWSSGRPSAGRQRSPLRSSPCWPSPTPATACWSDRPGPGTATDQAARATRSGGPAAAGGRHRLTGTSTFEVHGHECSSHRLLH